MLGSLLGSCLSVPTLSLVVITLLVIYYFTKGEKYANLPPMPVKPLPIFGHATLFKPTADQAVMRWREKAGDIFRFYIGSNMHVAMCNLDILKEAFVKQADYFSDRPVNFTMKAVAEGENGDLVAFGGSPWKEQRNVSVAIMKAFGMGKNWMAEKISEEVHFYVKALAETKGKPTNVKPVTHNAVSNVTFAFLIGNRFDYDDQYITRLNEILADKIGTLTASSIVDIFPFLEHMPGDFFGVKKIKKLNEEMVETFTNLYINKFKDDFEDTSEDNFIKAYLREMYKRRESGTQTTMDLPNLYRVVDSIITAGTETTSSTILWSYVYATNFPKAQAKLYEEIKEVVGTERLPTLQDRPKLNYLNAFILETQRMGSVVPLGISHVCNKTTTVAGYTIPEGTVILPHLDAVLKDKKAWGDPDTFRPERFLDKDGNVFIPDEFVPYSIGRRLCLGESLAKMELFLSFSTVYQRFEIVPEVSNRPPNMAPVLGLTSAPHHFKVRFIERNPKS